MTPRQLIVELDGHAKATATWLRARVPFFDRGREQDLRNPLDLVDWARDSDVDLLQCPDFVEAMSLVQSMSTDHAFAAGVMFSAMVRRHELPFPGADSDVGSER